MAVFLCLEKTMAEAITSLTLEINTQSVDEASRKLDAFSKKAEDAASATDELTAAKKRSLNVTDEELKDFERVYQNAVKNAKATRVAAEQERKLVVARIQLAESGDRLYTSYRNQIDGLKNVSTASKELEKISSRLRESYKSGAIDINNYNQLLSDVAVKQKEVTIAETLATKAKTDFINKLKAQLATQNLTKEQLLSYQAAQLGVSSSADIYIKKIAQASNATKNYENTTRAATHQAAIMQTQLMQGNFSGLRNSGMSMIMKNGVGNTFSTLLTSLNPLNIGISAMVGLLGSMIPKLFETENATEQLAAAQERLNTVMSKDKQAGKFFLSDDMMKLLKKNKFLVQAALKSSEKDLKTVVSKAKKDLQDGLKSLEQAGDEFIAKKSTLSEKTGLNDVLTAIQEIKASGKDLSDLLKSTDALTVRSVEGIKKKIGNYATYFGTTKEQAQSILEQMAEIRAETDSLQATEKINKLIEEVSKLYITSNNGSDKLKSFIDSLVEIAAKAGNAALQVELLKLQQENLDKAIDPKKSPFYYYSQMKMTPRQRADAEIKDMEAAAKINNEMFGPNSPNYASEQDIKDVAKAIKARHLKNGGRGTSTTDMLQSSRQQEISLMNQLKSLREQSLTVNTITSERKKYFDLQAQIEVLESKTDKSKLTAQEKYILGHKEALLAQQAKNAALSEEIAQYETATKALRKMQEYSTNLVAKSLAEQATFGMTSKNAGRYNEMSELNAQRDIALKGTSNPNEIAKVTEEYNKAKEALQQSWQQEDQNQGDWITGMKVGLCEFAEDGQNVFKGFRDVANNAMNSISHSLTELVTTGKMDFKSLTKSILTNIIEIINKLLVAQAIQTSMKWMGMGGSGAATGGYQQAYTGGVIDGYANGGGVGYSDEPGGFTGIGNKYQPAGIVHKGEFVFTKEATKRLGVANLYALMRDAQHGYANGGYVKGNVNLSHLRNSSSSTNVNVSTNVQVNAVSNEQRESEQDKQRLVKAYKETINQAVIEGIDKALAQNGAIYKAMQSRN